MKKITNKKDSHKIVLIIILILCIVLNSLSFNKTKIYKNIYNSRLDIEKTLKEPIKKVLYKSFSKEYDSLYEENISLKEENENLKITNEENNQKNQELLDLKNVLELNKLYTDYNIINAKVIERKPDSFYEQLIIDKGSKNNITIKEAVVTSSGLIGIVKEVFDDYSIISLLSSKNINNISVTIKSSQDYQGILNEYENNYFKITGITNYDNVLINDIVETSGYGTLPKGIKIGVVNKIENDQYNTSKIVYVKPQQSLNNISYVAVLKG